MSVSVPLAAPRLATTAGRRRRINGAVAIFVLVFAVEFAFGMWMAARGFRWNDSMSRSASALSVLYSADPKLANIGFVWPPLPTLLGVFWALLYPIWPGIVSSGASAALSTATCSGATAAMLLLTARKLGLSNPIGWAFALLVAANPMLFLYGSNGMPEGVAAPFLIGAVCGLTLFWHSGERVWIAAAGVAIGLAVASEYPAVPYGGAVCMALVAGILWSSEARVWAPLGRARAIEGLGLLLVVPPVFIGLLWLGFNAVIMGDPLDFMYGDYGYGTFQRSADPDGPVAYVTGDPVGALALVGERVFPFLIPLALILLMRLVDGRFWRVNTLCVTLLGLSVPLGMVVPLAILGSPMGFLRYLVYPLFVAAGWGLYEIAISRRRRAAVALILGGWLAAVPAALWIMTDARLGPEEQPRAESRGARARRGRLGHPPPRHASAGRAVPRERDPSRGPERRLRLGRGGIDDRGANPPRPHIAADQHVRSAVQGSDRQPGQPRRRLLPDARSGGNSDSRHRPRVPEAVGRRAARFPAGEDAGDAAREVAHLCRATGRPALPTPNGGGG